MHAQQLALLETLTFGPDLPPIAIALKTYPAGNKTAYRNCDCYPAFECVEAGICTTNTPNPPQPKPHSLTLIPNFATAINSNVPRSTPLQLPCLTTGDVKSLNDAWLTFQDKVPTAHKHGLADLKFSATALSPPVSTQYSGDQIHVAAIKIEYSHTSIIDNKLIKNAIERVIKRRSGDGSIHTSHNDPTLCYNCGTGDHQAFQCQIYPDNDTHNRRYEGVNPKSICRADPCTTGKECRFSHYSRTPNHLGQLETIKNLEHDPTNVHDDLWGLDVRDLRHRLGRGEHTTTIPQGNQHGAIPGAPTGQFFATQPVGPNIHTLCHDTATPIYATPAFPLSPSALTNPPTFSINTTPGSYPNKTITDIMHFTKTPLAPLFGPFEQSSVLSAGRTALGMTADGPTARMPFASRKTLSAGLGYAPNHPANILALKAIQADSLAALAAANLQEQGITLILITINKFQYLMQAFGPQTPFARFAVRFICEAPGSFIIAPLINPEANATETNYWPAIRTSKAWWLEMANQVTSPPPPPGMRHLPINRPHLPHSPGQP